MLATQAHQRRRLRAVRGRPDARRGRAGAGAADRDATQRRLRLPQPQGAGLRSDRPRRLRPRGPGRPRRLRLHRARRLPLRRDRAGHRAAARRPGAWPRSTCRSRSWSSGRTASNTAAPSLPDQGVGGRALAVPLVSSAPTGTWRVRAFTDPKRPPVGEATFMVEDYVPDRLEFELASNAKGISRTSPAEITVDGRYLYGAPAAQARARRRGDRFARAPSGRALPAISSGSPTRTSRPRASRSTTCRRPMPNGKARFARDA